MGTSANGSVVRTLAIDNLARLDRVGLEFGGRHLVEVVRTAPTSLEPRFTERAFGVDDRLPGSTQPDQEASGRVRTGNRVPGMCLGWDIWH